MRSLLSKITATCAVLFMLLGLIGGPAASAQPYPPVTPTPAPSTAVDCVALEPPVLSTSGTNLTVEGVQGFLTCDLRWVVEINPVLYDGPPPVSGLLTLPIPALDGDDHTATITVYRAIGTQKSASVKISAATLAAARANFPADGAVPAAAPVVGQAPQNLAFTGSSLNLPLAAGALLVGAGGLTLLAARKREQDA